MASQSIISEFISYIKKEKKWWMIPLLIVGVIVGSLVVLAEVAPQLAPLIYPFF